MARGCAHRWESPHLHGCLGFPITNHALRGVEVVPNPAPRGARPRCPVHDSGSDVHGANRLSFRMDRNGPAKRQAGYWRLRQRPPKAICRKDARSSPCTQSQGRPSGYLGAALLNREPNPPASPPPFLASEKSALRVSAQRGQSKLPRERGFGRQTTRMAWPWQIWTEHHIDFSTTHLSPKDRRCGGCLRQSDAPSGGIPPLSPIERIVVSQRDTRGVWRNTQGA